MGICFHIDQESLIVTSRIKMTRWFPSSSQRRNWERQERRDAKWIPWMKRHFRNERLS